MTVFLLLTSEKKYIIVINPILILYMKKLPGDIVIIFKSCILLKVFPKSMTRLVLNR